MSTLITNSNLKLVIEGINRGSFCKSKATERYVSIAHYVTLQSMQCLQLKESYLPDGYFRHPDGNVHQNDRYFHHSNGNINSSRIFIWLPTPDSSAERHAEYVAKCRNLIDDLVQQNPDFTELVLDLRCNIGGVLATFINAILPIIAGYGPFREVIEGSSKKIEYMHGKDVNDKNIATFTIEKSAGKLQHIINVDGDILVSDLLPVSPISDKFKGKRISILCNRYTMSSGEILCMLFRHLGEMGYFDCKLYGEKTRGLTNGCMVKTIGDVSVTIPIYYLGCGNTYYKKGIISGILPLSAIAL